jgi:hypothetical protein
MISLRILSEFEGGRALSNAFANDELDAGCRCLMPYIEADLVEGRVGIWLAVVAYPRTIPKRWSREGRMIGVKLSVLARDVNFLYSFPSVAELEGTTDITSAEITKGKLILTTPTTNLALVVSSVRVSAVLPLGAPHYGPEHVGKQVGKF